MRSVVANLLTIRTDIQAQNLWMNMAHQLMEVYVTKSDVCSCCISKNVTRSFTHSVINYNIDAPRKICTN